MIKNALNVQQRLLANWQKNMEFAKRPFKMPLVESTGLICPSRRKENDYEAD